MSVLTPMGPFAQNECLRIDVLFEMDLTPFQVFLEQSTGNKNIVDRLYVPSVVRPHISPTISTTRVVK
jgi:hypothetical protein